LDIAAISGPIALSFDSRVHYVASWKKVLLASLIVSIPFLIHDEIFTSSSFWGFNDLYITGFKIGNLPIEEILFFFAVPFSCVFIYACCNYYFRKWNAQLLNRIVQLLVFGYIVFLLLTDWQGWYTLTISIAGIGVLILWITNKRVKHGGLAFILSVIPFFGMNGILTGIMTPEPVVWYSEAEKIPGRITTIPFEDLIYAFTLIMGVILIFEYLRRNEKNRITV
jgi:lycopene cyclase domain-containing protein